MRIPILVEYKCLVAALHSALTDSDLLTMRNDLIGAMTRDHIRGLILDVAELDVMDCFVAAVLRKLAETARLLGIPTVLVGLRPELALTMSIVGLNLGPVAAAQDMEEALANAARG